MLQMLNTLMNQVSRQNSRLSRITGMRRRKELSTALLYADQK